MSLSIQSQQWLDTALYPFENRFISLGAGQMHYVDEGEGDIILFVHGTPAWSFLYREHIAELSKNYRCIAIDHIGFGLSEKPEAFDEKPESHSDLYCLYLPRPVAKQHGLPYTYHLQKL